MIPVFVVGMFFKDYVENLFGSILIVGCALLITSALLLFSERKSFSRRECQSAERNGISWKQAFIIGVGQACAVVPGLSRSGTTIATGLFTGVRKEIVAQFSFLMVLVPILGETFLDVVGGEMAASSTHALPLVLGFVSAFVSGLFACRFMIAVVKKAKLKWFALYCAVAGTVVIVSQLV